LIYGNIVDWSSW